MIQQENGKTFYRSGRKGLQNYGNEQQSEMIQTSKIYAINMFNSAIRW